MDPISPENNASQIIDSRPPEIGTLVPRGVPWDQNFWPKNFLISSSNDHILSILWDCFAKNAEK